MKHQEVVMTAYIPLQTSELSKPFDKLSVLEEIEIVNDMLDNNVGDEFEARVTTIIKKFLVLLSTVSEEAYLKETIPLVALGKKDERIKAIFERELRAKRDQKRSWWQQPISMELRCSISGIFLGLRSRKPKHHN
jgi:hypothetical protein